MTFVAGVKARLGSGRVPRRPSSAGRAPAPRKDTADAARWTRGHRSTWKAASPLAPAKARAAPARIVLSR